MKQGLVITIDGPSGTGKSTAARGLAKKLGYLYLDTGAMYRAIALKALRKKIPLTGRRALVNLARRSKVGFRVDPGHQLRILLDSTDVTEAIRRHEVSEAASRVASVAGVRRALVQRQKEIGRRGRIVAEGRDTGTVVFRSADLKFFMTATAKERARRRFEELHERGEKVTFAEVFQDVRQRDKRDRSRAASPLRRAAGAILIDNTKLQSAQVIDKMLVYVQRLRRK